MTVLAGWKFFVDYPLVDGQSMFLPVGQVMSDAFLWDL
jgi:hypothetical protein